MPDNNAITAPVASGVIDQRFLIEPLRASSNPTSYLDRFPEEVYDKSITSHLVRFIYTLIGPAGVASIKRNLFQARLELEAHGLEIFNLEKFYGDPFAFGRILEETSEQDFTGLISAEEWETIKAKDEAYRNRAIDFMKGVRGGNSPAGLTLIAKSGLGHEVELIENYKFFFDQHSDDPLGLPYVGQTRSTEEFIIIPRQEISSTEVQRIHVNGFPDGGTFILSFRGQNSTQIDFDAHYLEVQAALQGISTVGVGNAEVRGGPIPNDFIVTFKGALADRDVPTLTATSALYEVQATESILCPIVITTEHAGNESVDEVVRISERDKHNLQSALDRIRPVNTIPSYGKAPGTTSRQRWQTVTPSSQYVETRKFVTGAPEIPWPKVSKQFWIEPDKEKSAPSTRRVRQAYVHYHNVSDIHAYTEAATDDAGYLSDIRNVDNFTSEHVGAYGPEQSSLFPILRQFANYTDQTFPAEAALENRQSFIRFSDRIDGTAIFNEGYPLDYLTLVNRRYRRQRAPFWSSATAEDGSEYLELDLGSVKAVNYLSFSLIHKPLKIEIDFDTFGGPYSRQFVPAYPLDSRYFPTNIVHMPGSNPWQNVKFLFQNKKGEIPYTRFIRIRFERQTGSQANNLGAKFLWDSVHQVQVPWTIEVRSLQVGRFVSAAPTRVNRNKYLYQWWDL